MFTALQIGFGTSTGVLIYDRFLATDHKFNWPRAAFVGVLVFLGLWLYDYLKSKKSGAAA